MSTVSHKPAIVETRPLTEGSKCLGTFVFNDGVTIRSTGGLVCSQHGHRHCTHHKLAHDLIVSTAASQEAATLAAEVALLDELLTEQAIEAAEDYDADYDAWLDVVSASLPLPTPLAPDDEDDGDGDYDAFLRRQERADIDRLEAADFLWNGDAWVRTWVRAQRGC